MVTVADAARAIDRKGPPGFRRATASERTIDLIAAQDEIASGSGSNSTADDYRAELARRDIDK
jgi:hypothetical protein